MSFRQLLTLAALVLGLFSSFHPFQIGSGIVLGLFVTVSVFPRSPATRLLFTHHGPSLDVARMSRKECWRSAVGFLAIAGGACATVFALTLLEPWLGKQVFDVPVVAMLLFMYTLFALMGLGGALYLAVRAPFRPQVIDVPKPPDHGA